MGIATNESILEGQIGRIGPVVTRRVRGKTVVSIATTRRSRKSKTEVANHDLFRIASKFAKNAMRDPALRANFENEAKKRKISSAFNAAVSLKRKELKALAEEQPHKPSTIVIESQKNVETSSHVMQAFQEIENVVENALSEIRMAWKSVNAQKFSEQQVAVLRTTLRMQIREGVNSLDRI